MPRTWKALALSPSASVARSAHCAGLDDVALAPGLNAALERDIGAVAGLFPGHFVNKSFQLVERLQPGIHAGERVHRGLGQGLGHVQSGLENQPSSNRLIVNHS